MRLSGLRQAFGLGGTQVAVRLAFGFASIKVTAVYLGPAGLALVAQLGNFIGLCQGVLANGANTAVVRLSAEHGDDPPALRRLFGTAGRLAIVLAAAVALLIVLLAPWLAQWLLTDASHAPAVRVAAFAVAAAILNGILLGALNGAREIGLVVAANVASTVLGFLLFVPACVLWGVAGGLIGSALAYVIALPVTLLLLLRSRRIRLGDFLAPPAAREARRIAGFYPMLIAHAALAPLALILIRDLAARQAGLDEAGLWQAAWRLSEIYLLVVTTSVSLYLMPRLGEVAGNPSRLRMEVWRCLKSVAAITACLALALFLLRHQVVGLVFSGQFARVADLMPLQLLGDVLRMAAWCLGFVLVALVRSRWYVCLEILVPAAYLAGAAALVETRGVEGIPLAYCGAEALHFALAAFALRDVLFARQSEEAGR